MRRQNTPGDVRAGVAAAVVLAVLVFILRLNPVLATVLALAVFAGLRMLTPPVPAHSARSRWLFGDRVEASPEEVAFAAAYADVAAIEALAARVAKPETRAQLGRILERADRILTVMHADENLAAAPVLESRILEPLLALLTEYTRVAARGIQSAGDLLEKIETVDLPLIEKAVTDFYERLHQRQVIDLATLSEMLEINLDSVRATMRRRTTP